MTSRLAQLRAEMKKMKIDGFFIPRADEYQGEYVPPAAERLAYITGFTGSAGNAIALHDTAAFFTDGRYTLQAREQVAGSGFDVYSTSEGQDPTPTLLPTEWLEKNLKRDQRFGIDPWLHTPAEVRRLDTACARARAELVFIKHNPLDLIWQDRPPAPVTPAVPHPLQFAGVSSQDKRRALGDMLKRSGVDALAITLPEEICWLLNIRGNDVPCNPFCLSYALATADGAVDWFVDAAKVSPETRGWLGDGVQLHAPADYAPMIDKLARSGWRIQVDPMSAPYRVMEVAGKTALSARSPLQLMKARKNDVELDGIRRAHLRDGAAVTRFLAALAQPEIAGKLDELSAAALLEKFRQGGEHHKGPSFDTISGAGGNGAIVHYRADEKSNRPLTSGPVYLVDSGAQYLDGTTDITRTVAVGAPTDEQRRSFTLVLKAHIAVATATFPAGTTGDKIDRIARAPMQAAGLDYAHGTGHGVGCYLSVHEGPAGLSPRAASTALEPGMVLSNEPGYYKEGEYGIRIENLVTVIDTGKINAEYAAVLAFETLTLAPIDRRLVEPSLLTDAEREWLNSYHARVRTALAPLLDPATAAYLDTATKPI